MGGHFSCFGGTEERGETLRKAKERRSMVAIVILFWSESECGRVCRVCVFVWEREKDE